MTRLGRHTVEPDTNLVDGTRHIAGEAVDAAIPAGGASLLAFYAALAVLDVERSSSDANITDFGDAMWWAVTTMTTIGYGDRYPVTGVGRLVAFALMVGGIALLGTVTATLASWLVETVAAE
jgi:voltage-gated potassium channel